MDAKAIDGSKAAGIELPRDLLIKYVNKYLDNEQNLLGR